MRVLHVLPTLGYGGITTVVLNYYNILKKNNINVNFDFITHGKYEKFHDDLQKQGSKIFYIPTVRSVGVIKYFRSVNKVIYEGNFDIIHLHSEGIRLFLLKYSKKIGIKKRIVHSHSANYDKKLGFIWRFLTKKYATDLLACGTNAGLSQFKKMAFTVLPNAIDISKIYNTENLKVDEIKTKLGLMKDDFVIGQVGVFIDQKNHTFTLEILKKLKTLRRNFKMIFVGDGFLKNKIQALTKEYGLSNEVIFINKTSEVMIYYKIFDLLVMPSLYEGLPMVGVEAQLSGLYCLFSSNIDNTLDANVNKSCFLTIDEGPQLWVDKIIEIMNNPKDNPIPINEAFNSQYNIHNSVDILLSIYGVEE